ncbi:MAG: gliding motility-associated C-terminal domain-containing protein, partial [Bacteroidetes bacterium]|nr:gliding motility-associated C-terminal domain-containing protein [Bacteroidota bacterium]
LALIKVNDTCLKVPDSICVEEAIYQKNITLPPRAGGYYLTYQTCCRNRTILNIENPGGTGAIYTAYIPDISVAKYNSNPAFNNFPPILVCLNDPLKFDHSATDIDGDLLVYELCTPYDRALGSFPYPFVTWTAPYTANDPLGGVPLSINSNGSLTGAPNTMGQFVVGVCVKEYRNGVLLSENKRDFQFNVTECSDPTAAIAPGVMQFCGDTTVTFPNESQAAFSYEWDFGDPTTTTDTDTAKFPTYTYPSTGTYTVRLIANPGSACIDTGYIAINIESCDTNIFYIPNAFSPNGDGKNDTLFVRGIDIKNIKLSIYNHWGEKVFETDNITDGWDGTLRRKKVTPAVFAWYAEVEFNDEKKVYRKGNVTLIK